MEITRLLLPPIIALLMVICCIAKACDKTCRISRAYRMLMADCYHQELKEFPCLRSDIQVIDLTLNRIRHLEEEDLEQFSSLRMLYLTENMIMRIDDRAFKDQNDLEVLDLTMNSFNSLPPTIFQLPSLRRLSLGHNENANIVEIISKLGSIASPLEYLDLSYNRMNRLPVLVALPTLLVYNISGNEKLEMTTKHFTGMCNLLELVNDNVTNRFSDACECWILKNWLETRNVRFKSFDCEEFIEEDMCNATDVPLQDLEDFESCKQLHNQMVERVKLMNIVLPVIIVVSIAFLVAILVILFRWRRQRTESSTWRNHHDEAKDSLNKNPL